MCCELKKWGNLYKREVNTLNYSYNLKLVWYRPNVLINDILLLVYNIRYFNSVTNPSLVGIV